MCNNCNVVLNVQNGCNRKVSWLIIGRKTCCILAGEFSLLIGLIREYFSWIPGHLEPTPGRGHPGSGAKPPQGTITHTTITTH